MTSDPWQTMLHDFIPDYNELKDLMESGPRYVPTLRLEHARWRLEIVEQWADGIEYKSEFKDELDIRCRWCDQQLSTWPGVWRTLISRLWYFDNKHDAEKFITLYYLKWQ